MAGAVSIGAVWRPDFPVNWEIIWEAAETLPRTRKMRPKLLALSEPWLEFPSPPNWEFDLP